MGEFDTKQWQIEQAALFLSSFVIVLKSKVHELTTKMMKLQ